MEAESFYGMSQLMLTLSYTLQDGAPLCHRCDPTWRPNTQTEDEDGSSQPHVGFLCYCRLLYCNDQLKTLDSIAACLWFIQVLWSIWKIWRLQNGEIKAEEAKTTAGNNKSDKYTVMSVLPSNPITHILHLPAGVWSLRACFSEPQQEVLDITRQLLAELGQHNDCEIEEKKSKLEQLKTVLEMWVTSKLGH